MRVAKTNKQKAKNCATDSHPWNVSVPIINDTAQINTVLQVSIVDLFDAEAYFVIATPVALKKAIENTIPTVYTIRTGFSPIY